MNERTEQQDTETASKYYQEGWNDTRDTLLLRLDPTATLINIEMDLLGREWNDTINNGNGGFVQVAEPKMKETGVKKLMIELRSRISIDSVLGNLTDKKVNDIVRETGEVVLEFLWFNSDKYNISESDWSSIEKIIRHKIHVFLSRSVGGMQNKLIHDSMRMSEITQRRASGEQGYVDNKKSYDFMGLFKK